MVLTADYFFWIIFFFLNLKKIWGGGEDNSHRDMKSETGCEKKCGLLSHLKNPHLCYKVTYMEHSMTCGIDAFKIS